MRNPYRNIQSSLLRFCSDFAAEMGNFGYAMTKVNLDAKGSPKEWPAENFIGVSDIQYDFDESVVQVTLAFVISTVEDMNLHRMDEIINHLVERLLVGSRVLIVDALSGAPLGHLTVANGLRVGVIANTDTQPAKPVFVRLISDQTVKGPA